MRSFDSMWSADCCINAANFAAAQAYPFCLGSAGLYNLGRLREEGKAAQHQLWDLHTLLMEMCKQIRDHSVLEDKMSPEEWGTSFSLVS